MADEIERKLLEQVKEQEELVRKLKAAKANDVQDSTNFSILETQLESINHDFADVSYVCGWIPTIKDTKFFDFCVTFIDDQLLSKWPHLKRWFTNVQSFDQIERNTFLEPKGSITSLVKKVDRLRNLCLFDKNVIDLKFNNQH